MRFVTWNCNGAFKAKYEHVAAFDDDYGDDILVIQEAEHPDLLPAVLLERYPNVVWVEHNRNKGLLVLASERYRIDLAPEYDPEYKFVVPVSVTGESEFTLIAVWAQKLPGLSYAEYVLNGIKRYESLINDDTVIAGDFNSPPKVGARKGVADHMELTAWLERHGLFSAYHDMCEEAHGEEVFATYAHRRDLSQRFHIDYVFASEKALLGGGAAFHDIDENDVKLSDHVPLFVDPEIRRIDTAG